ncbi:MAG TPA: UPF0182 family protein, partial [Gemmatimonadales bacterium]
RRGAVLLLGAAVALLIGGRWIALATAERAWAETIPAGAVYLAVRQQTHLVELAVLALALIWGVGNLGTVYRAIGSVQMPRRLGDLEIVEAVPPRMLVAITVASGLLYGGALAWAGGGSAVWRTLVLASAPPHFGIVDPVLHRDLGYYLGELPWAEWRQRALLVASGTALLLTGALYLAIGSVRLTGGKLIASPHARTHLGVLLAALAVAFAWGAALDPMETVVGLHGPVDHAVLATRMPGAVVVEVAAAIAALCSLAWGWWDRARLVGVAWALTGTAMVAVYWILTPSLRNGATGITARADTAAYPAERAAFTRIAFGTTLAALPEGPNPAVPDLSGIPLWDPARVARAVARTAGLAPGTGPGPAAWSDGRRWIVGLAPDAAGLAEATVPRTWDDVHRGAWAHVRPGLFASEADSGLSLAPVPGADAWFGPGFTDYAVADPAVWPRGHAPGIPLDGAWRRVALAWALQSVELVRDRALGQRLLWRRDVVAQLERLAPFARFDAPAPVLVDGALTWVSYGYVESDYFPLVTPLTWGDREIRYRRAGLLGAVDARTGRLGLWLVPGADSLSAGWTRRFAPLVQPADSLPPALRAALPYPRDAFALAAAVVARERPLDIDTISWTPLPAEPYDLTAALPGAGERPVLAQSFVHGLPQYFAGLLAGAMTADGPVLYFWHAPPGRRMPVGLVGSPETRPGVPRVWLAGDSLVTLQALFEEPALGTAPPRVAGVYLTWGRRLGDGATVPSALRNLLFAVPRDSVLGLRWREAQSLVARIDSALAARDFQRFGLLYGQLKALLGLGRPAVASPPAPR